MSFVQSYHARSPLFPGKSTEAMGAFVDDALSADDALMARTGARAQVLAPDPARDRLQRLGRWVSESAGAGKAVVVDPDVAEVMAAFVEDALSVEDAAASRVPASDENVDRRGDLGRRAVDAAGAGAVVPVDREVAEDLAAFPEDAVSAEDALRAKAKPDGKSRKGTARNRPGMER